MAEVHRYRKERDPSENLEWSIPNSQHIALSVIWLLELYPPSHSIDLMRDLRQAGWRSDFGRFNLLEWITAGRERSGTGAWANLGVAMRPGKQTPFITSNYLLTQLPQSVDRALIDLTLLSQGLTVLRVGFVITDTASQSIEAAARAVYPTRFRPVGAGLEESTPQFRKQEAASVAMDIIRDQCTVWMRKKFHGVFAGGLLDGLYPSVALLATSGIAAFDQESPPLRFLRILGLDHTFEAWEADELTGLRATWGEWLHKRRPEFVLAVRREEAAPAQWITGMGGSIESLAWRVHDQFRSLMPIWAARHLVIGYQVRLARARDRLTPTGNGLTDRRSALEAVHRSIVIPGFDVRLVAGELVGLVDEKNWLMREIPKLHPLDPSLWSKPASLGELWIDRLVQAARDVLSREEDLRQLHVLWSTTEGGLANLRLQKRITFLTWVLVAFTFALTVIGVLSYASLAPR